MNWFTAGLLLVLLNIGFGKPAKAQESCRLVGKSIPELRRANFWQEGQPLSGHLFRWYRSAMPFWNLTQPAVKQATTAAVARIPSLYDYDQLGFFCKWEVRLEAAAQFPVKFRLGEVNYVDRLERKAKMQERFGINIRK